MNDASSHAKRATEPATSEKLSHAETARQPLTLHQRITELSEQHGSLRAAAAVLGCDPGYLSRLAAGHKDDPGDHLLERMGLRQVVTYERATDTGITGAQE